MSTQRRYAQRVARFQRVAKRRALFPSTASPQEVSCLVSESITSSVTNDEPGTEHVMELRDKVYELTEKCQNMELEINLLRKERDIYKQKLDISRVDMDSLHMNDAQSEKKLKYYTGVPSIALFMWIFNLVCAYFTDRRAMSMENQLLLTLMKLRHGLQNSDLAYRFGASSSTVSDIINECIPTLAQTLKFFIRWPSKAILLSNMPMKFKRTFGNCRVIIDCTAFFVERPYNLRSQAQTWSSYKHHHTLKALIGITPYGAVSFVSKVWGGCISDKEITQKSGFYRMI